MTEQEMRDFVQELRDKFYPNIDMPVVEFNSRLRTTAGRAWARRIEINQKLGTMVGLEGMKQTLAHEFAHCVQRQQERIDLITQPHGPEWQKIMRTMGFQPDRTHKLFDEYKIEQPKGQRRWDYVSQCCGFKWQVATVTHNRIQSGKRGAVCNKCSAKGSVIWTGKEIM